MQSIYKWRVSLSQNSHWIIGLAPQKQSFLKAHQCFSSFPQQLAKGANSDDIRVDRKGLGTWARDGNRNTSDETASRAKSRLVELDDSQLVDTRSLLKTLTAHQRANADRVRIRILAGRETRNSKRNVNDSTVTHVTLEPGQRLAHRDYQGKARALAYDWEIIGNVPRYLRLPWMKELDSQKPSRESALKRLNTEIQALNRFLSPTTEEMNSAQTALNDIRKIFQQYTGCHRLDVIGSRASGLATALSDLDLNLVWEGSADAGSEKSAGGPSLARVWRKLRFDGPANSPIMLTHYLKNARVPIIVGIHGFTGLEFQIQIASSGYGSLELVKGFQAEWPTLQSLFKVLKQALQMRALCKGPQGGITSYPLLNMIVVSLKEHQMLIDRFDAGKQLLQFLDFWSDIDFYTTGITHHPSKYLRERLDEHQEDNPLTAANAVSLITQDPIGAVPVQFDVRKKLVDIHEGQSDFHMTLHDPANPYNDLGRSAHRIKDVQATFIAMRQKLKGDMAEWDNDVRKNGHGGDRPVALLRSLIEGDYSIHNMLRRRLSPSTQE